MNDNKKYFVHQETVSSLENMYFNDVITMIQHQLKTLGYYDVSITGSYDHNTKTAIKNFQTDHHLKNDGTLNDQTWDTLYSNRNNLERQVAERQTRPVLRLGSTGPYVTELQTILKNLLYYTGTIDGNFGNTTALAVKTFQTNNHLTPDGVVGRDTWSALSTLYSPLAICDDNENGNGNNPISYTVVAGDSLWSIAKQFNTTVEAIKQLNQLTSDVIYVGQQLLIPSGNDNGTPPTYTLYTVVAGDSLWNIAKRFNTTVEEIKSLNNLTSNLLTIGQQLKIPSDTSNVITYTVIAGDTLWKIAQKFNTTVNTLKSFNNLTNDTLNIGQQLRIPINRNE